MSDTETPIETFIEPMETEQESQEQDPLATAPEHIKLAVDLIYLLESNDIPVKTALDALEIVKEDLEAKR